MKLFGRYLKLNFKRTAKAYIGIFALTLVLLTIIASIGYAFLHEKKNDESLMRMTVGIVGDKNDKTLNMGITLLKVADTSRLTIDFLNYYSEDDAVKAMKGQKIMAYIVVPQGFAESIMSGENKKLNYVMAESGAAMSSLLTRDVADVVSNYIVETQAGVTAMCDYAEAKGFENSKVKNIDIDMSLEYINLIVGRERFVSITEVGLGGRISFAGYYICGFTVFFLLCFGIACCTLRVKSSRALDRLLYSKGYGVWCQVLGEYIPYISIAVITLLIPFCIAVIVSGYINFPVPELKYWIFSDYALIPFKLLPAVFVITALQFLLYELVSGIINSVLLQFITSVVLAYISGCFYPIYFMPDFVQRLSSLLPSGVAINYFSGLLTEDLSTGALVGCVIYGFVFLILSVTARKVRISASEGQ